MLVQIACDRTDGKRKRRWARAIRDDNEGINGAGDIRMGGEIGGITGKAGERVVRAENCKENSGILVESLGTDGRREPSMDFGGKTRIRENTKADAKIQNKYGM
jgi:hypothetical protein